MEGRRGLPWQSILKNQSTQSYGRFTSTGDRQNGDLNSTNLASSNEGVLRPSVPAHTHTTQTDWKWKLSAA